MLKRRYAIAIALGVFFGVVSIATTAEFHYGSWDDLSQFGKGAWHIPGWDTYQSFEPGLSLDLKHKAVLLRMCQVFLEQGFASILIPVLLCSGAARLDELSAQSRHLYCLTRSLLITVICVSVVAIPWAIGASQHDTEAPKILEGQILYAYHAYLFLFLMAVVSLLAPAFWILVYVGLWWHTRKFPVKLTVSNIVLDP